MDVPKAPIPKAPRSSLEQNIYGRKWDSFHEGYFSSIRVARCFFDVVREAIAAGRPQAVVDLGGGTGFLLAMLREELSPCPKLIDLDRSPIQLDVAAQRGIACWCGSVTDFKRGELAPEEHRFLFIMRSVLHYFGREGLPPLLRHLRSQARQAELFVHQTACFEHQEEADCLNTLYREMGTTKWYPTWKQLRAALEKEGWELLSEQAAPPLPLTGADLAKRYDLDAESIRRICRKLAPFAPMLPHLLRLTPENFHADLHYRILTCKARQPFNRRPLAPI